MANKRDREIRKWDLIYQLVLHWINCQSNISIWANYTCPFGEVLKGNPDTLLNGTPYPPIHWALLFLPALAITVCPPKRFIMKTTHLFIYSLCVWHTEATITPNLGTHNLQIFGGYYMYIYIYTYPYFKGFKPSFFMGFKSPKVVLCKEPRTHFPTPCDRDFSASTDRCCTGFGNWGVSIPRNSTEILPCLFHPPKKGAQTLYTTPWKLLVFKSVKFIFKSWFNILYIYNYIYIYWGV